MAKDDYQLGFGTRIPTWDEIVDRKDFEAETIMRLVVELARSRHLCMYDLERIYNEIVDMNKVVDDTTQE